MRHFWKGEAVAIVRKKNTEGCFQASGVWCIQNWRMQQGLLQGRYVSSTQSGWKLRNWQNSQCYVLHNALPIGAHSFASLTGSEHVRATVVCLQHTEILHDVFLKLEYPVYLLAACWHPCFSCPCRGLVGCWHKWIQSFVHLWWSYTRMLHVSAEHCLWNEFVLQPSMNEWVNKGQSNLSGCVHQGVGLAQSQTLKAHAYLRNYRAYAASLNACTPSGDKRLAHK